jgi:RsiW-degrading membrane proteinase PrsW (M82 family)
MSDQASYADGVIAKKSVAKYADSIIQWGGVFRTIFTVLGWIYLAVGVIFGFYYGQNMYGNPFLFLILGALLGALGTLTMFGYRLVFDYMLMKAHQTKG